MPNWVFNSLVVSGEQSALDKMVEQLNQPFVKHFPEHKFENGEIVWVADEQHYDNPVFAFWNIVKPTDLESYYATDTFKGNKNITIDEDGKMNNDSFMKEFVRSMKEDQDWYRSARSENNEGILMGASGFDPVVNAEKNKLLSIVRELAGV